VLCKDAEGKIGMRLRAVNHGLFVCLVSKNSPAALAGLKFGDQILQINGQDVAGMDMEQGHKLLKKCDKNNIRVIVRDRYPTISFHARYGSNFVVIKHFILLLGKKTVIKSLD